MFVTLGLTHGRIVNNVAQIIATRLAVIIPLLAASLAAAQTLPSDAAPQNALAATLSRLLEDAIPPEYEKQKDWGATAEIPAGWRVTGKPFHLHMSQRTHTVNHGVWKHYKLRLIDPQQNLHVTLADVRTIGPGRVAFTLKGDAKIDAWARAKVYEYGVHLVALEFESDMRVQVVVQGELAVELHHGNSGATLAIVPVVTASRLEIGDFHLRRVSNAKGPLVRELGDGVRKLAEEELNGPRLTEKLNRAIAKKRDRLAFRPAELLESTWWPLGGWSEAASAPAPQ